MEHKYSDHQMNREASHGHIEKLNLLAVLRSLTVKRGIFGQSARAPFHREQLTLCAARHLARTYRQD
jgi:hypothetical protein